MTADSATLHAASHELCCRQGARLRWRRGARFFWRRAERLRRRQGVRLLARKRVIAMAAGRTVFLAAKRAAAPMMVHGLCGRRSAVFLAASRAAAPMLAQELCKRRSARFYPRNGSLPKSHANFQIPRHGTAEVNPRTPSIDALPQSRANSARETVHFRNPMPRNSKSGTEMRKCINRSGNTADFGSTASSYKMSQNSPKHLIARICEPSPRPKLAGCIRGPRGPFSCACGASPALAIGLGGLSSPPLAGLPPRLRAFADLVRLSPAYEPSRGCKLSRALTGRATWDFRPCGR